MTKPVFYITSTILFLMIPLVLMQITDEIKWGAMDFVVAGILFLSTIISVDYISRKFKKHRFKYIFIIGIILLLVIIWTELAVGIF